MEFCSIDGFLGGLYHVYTINDESYNEMGLCGGLRCFTNHGILVALPTGLLKVLAMHHFDIVPGSWTFGARKSR
jgi:hypothetical protein